MTALMAVIVLLLVITTAYMLGRAHEVGHWVRFLRVRRNGTDRPTLDRHLTEQEIKDVAESQYLRPYLRDPREGRER